MPRPFIRILRVATLAPVMLGLIVAESLLIGGAFLVNASEIGSREAGPLSRRAFG